MLQMGFIYFAKNFRDGVDVYRNYYGAMGFVFDTQSEYTFRICPPAVCQADAVVGGWASRGGLVVLLGELKWSVDLSSTMQFLITEEASISVSEPMPHELVSELKKRVLGFENVDSGRLLLKEDSKSETNNNHTRCSRQI